jgi:phage shock protein PspC (stress-responsive transcriptional regulator)
MLHKIITFGLSKVFFKMEKFKSFVELHAFGVCTRLGEKMGMSISNIRLFFIYTTFLTLGSPIVIYLVLAFIMDIRRYLRRANNPSVWDI